MLNDDQWKVSKEFATQYNSPLDRKLYCDDPLIKLLGDTSNKSILDMGCGNGTLTKIISQKGGKVIGIDTSEEMLKQAKKLESTSLNLHFQKSAAENLSFADSTFDIVVACMLINTINKTDTVKNIFKEAKRVLKAGGRFIIAMAHPLTLDKKTKFRWTEWKQGQSQKNLVPGESYKRKIMGKNGKILSVINNYWSPDVLINFARRNNFIHLVSLEPKATQNDLKQFSELDPALATVSFFLLMVFERK